MSSQGSNDLVVLYVLKNDLRSEQAEHLLKRLRFPLDIVRHDTPKLGKWGDEIYPTAIYRGASYKGLRMVAEFVDQVEFERRWKTRRSNAKTS